MIDSSGSAPQLRPFFGFYGGKWRDALKHYPPPAHDTIVEPFAGSAGYALRFCDRKVILCDLDPVLAGVWSYLIKVRPQEILRIPDLASDQTVDDLDICQEARWLIGFWLNRGVATPRRKPSKWMRIKIRPGSFWGERVRTTLARQVSAIRHWKVYNCSYVDAPAPKLATWFIDPPYQRAGQHYRFGSADIDYTALSTWCQQRKGQVMVCENQGADWLPFQPLASVKTTRSKRSKEAVWICDTTASRSTSRKKKRKRVTDRNVNAERTGQLKAA
jgi:site-specific DNA-adenine methylase